MTVKQKNALNRILKRELKKYPETSGLHASLDKWIISDGAVAVLFHQKPDSFPDGKQEDNIAEFIQKEFETADYFRISALIDIPDWKIATKGYQQKFIRGSSTPPIPDFHAFAQTFDGRTCDAHFNLQYVLDAVEAIGSKAIVYLSTERGHMPTLLVMHEDWMEDRSLPIAIVMPYRKKQRPSR